MENIPAILALLFCLIVYLWLSETWPFSPAPYKARTPPVLPQDYGTSWVWDPLKETFHQGRLILQAGKDWNVDFDGSAYCTGQYQATLIEVDVENPYQIHILAQAVQPTEFAALDNLLYLKVKRGSESSVSVRQYLKDVGSRNA